MGRGELLRESRDVAVTGCRNGEGQFREIVFVKGDGPDFFRIHKSKVVVGDGPDGTPESKRQGAAFAGVVGISRVPVLRQDQDLALVWIKLGPIKKERRRL